MNGLTNLSIEKNRVCVWHPTTMYPLLFVLPYSPLMQKKMFFSLIKEFFLVERRCRGGHGKISWHTTHNLFSSDIKD